MSTPTIDFSQYETSAAPPAQIDFSKYENHQQSSAVPSFWDTLAREGKSLVGNISGIPAAVYHAFAEPATKEETAEFGGPQEVSGAKRIGLGIHRLTTAPLETAVNFYKDAAHGKYGDASAIESAMLDVAPEAMGAGAAAVVAPKVAGSAMEAAPAAIGAVTDAASAIPEKLSAAVDAAKNVTPKQAAQVAGGASGAVAGHGPLSIPGAYYGARGAGNLVQGLLGKERANAPIFAKSSVYPGAPLPEAPAPEVLQAGSLARGQQPVTDPAAGLGKVPVQQQPVPVYPGAPLPEAPPAEVLQARGLTTGGAAPPPEPAAALGDLPVHAVHQAITELGPEASISDVTTRANQIAKLGGLLNDAVGGQPLKPNVPLRNQLQTATPASAPDIPEGHIPVQSSALKSYKYDPETREFESVTASGGRYIHGDVSPEQVEAFEQADSKGKAYNDIKNNSTYVGKIVDGKRMAVKPPAELHSAVPETPDSTAGSAPSTPIMPKSTTPVRDLTEIFQKMLEDAQRKKRLAVTVK